MLKSTLKKKEDKKKKKEQARRYEKYRRCLGETIELAGTTFFITSVSYPENDQGVDNLSISLSELRQSKEECPKHMYVASCGCQVMKGWRCQYHGDP